MVVVYSEESSCMATNVSAVRAALRHRISGHRVVVSITRHVEPDHEKVLEIIEAAKDAAAREHADPAVLEILAHAVAAAGNVAGNTHAPTCHQKENQS